MESSSLIGNQELRTDGDVKKILQTGAMALCDLARHTTTNARSLDEIDAFEAAVKHGIPALALLRRLHKHLDAQMPEVATAHVRDALESFLAELPFRD